MKLHKTLISSGKKLNLINDVVNLDLFSPGRAVFTVNASSALTGFVVFSASYDAQEIKPWFIGFIEKSTTVDSKQQRLFCRELSAVLYERLPLALRNANLEQVLAAITAETNLKFSIPSGKSYTSAKVPAFYNLANGYHAMDSLSALFGINKPIWQQTEDGSVFVGSWEDSQWSNKPFDLDKSWESEVSSGYSAKLPALPALRPGVLYNGSIITSIEFTGLKMQVTWQDNPWSDY